MNTSLDLTAAPREALLAVIAHQQNTIAQQQAAIVQLQRRIETLEGKAKPSGPRGMPGVKPPSGQRPPGRNVRGSPGSPASPASA